MSGMTDERYAELMDNPNEFLTGDEIVEGWHFCPEWDGLLIGPGMEEMQACRCEIAEVEG